MCFSTARVLMNRALAVASLLRPAASSWSTSRSRWVRPGRGDRESCALRARRPSTTWGSRTEPPRATSYRARSNSSRCDTRSFSRYPRPATPSDSRSNAYSSSTYCDSTTTPIDGCSERIRLAASMPSVVKVGGIRMSVRTASGRCRATDSSSAVESVTTSTRSTSSVSARSAEMPWRTRKLSSAKTTRNATALTVGPPSRPGGGSVPGGRSCAVGLVPGGVVPGGLVPGGVVPDGVVLGRRRTRMRRAVQFAAHGQSDADQDDTPDEGGDPEQYGDADRTGTRIHGEQNAQQDRQGGAQHQQPARRHPVAAECPEQFEDSADDQPDPEDPGQGLRRHARARDREEGREQGDHAQHDQPQPAAS